MINSILRKILGSANDRILKKYQKIAEHINTLESNYINLSDEELKNQTNLFRQQLQQGKTLDDILPNAFAAMREASKRVLGLRPFDVQLIGAMVLHNGMLPEMKTGEGKTLVATLAVYLNALEGKGVHVVTVNDYLARRDAEWMGKIYQFMGLSVGCILQHSGDQSRRQAYASDITYGTNSELGFDYLRDNMKHSKEDMVTRGYNYAIVDEVDSILIDEARTPLIISGPSEDSSDLYRKINDVVAQLQPNDFEKDEKQHSVLLTEHGIETVEQLLKDKNLLKGNGLYDLHNVATVHHINAALKAHKLYHRDVDYIVKNKEVIIIDEFTGRMMDGRRYSEGLHQAIEAKEGVNVAAENQTLASITYQNFFRMYKKLAGMAGTAMTEAPEFEEIYNLRVVSIPPNVPVARIDYEDEIYLTAAEKYQVVIELIKECKKREQPVLVGTTSIEKSELISSLLKKEKIKHNVLNARFHEQEASIIADAGRPGMVTVATNMAGRGTDIQLGGNLQSRINNELKELPEGEIKDKAIAKIKAEIAADREKVIKAGGLFIIGTERHESRRIDNQLRGRAGRQGDAGASKFLISLEDDLMRIFAAADKLQPMLRRLGAKDGEVISHRMITKALEKAQLRVEARNFDMRKHLLRYDDVMNNQRKVIYEQRWELINNHDIPEIYQEFVQDVINQLIQTYVPEDSNKEMWDLKGLETSFFRVFSIHLPTDEWKNTHNLSIKILQEQIEAIIKQLLQEKQNKYGLDTISEVSKTVLLRLIDQYWKDHLLTLDHLRQGINLRAYAQGNPLNEYKHEAFNLFRLMLNNLKVEFVSIMTRFEISEPSPKVLADLQKTNASNILSHDAKENIEEFTLKQNVDPVTRAVSFDWSKTQRNAACPCNSGRKFKHCHGVIDAL